MITNIKAQVIEEMTDVVAEVDRCIETDDPVRGLKFIIEDCEYRVQQIDWGVFYIDEHGRDITVKMRQSFAEQAARIRKRLQTVGTNHPAK